MSNSDITNEHHLDTNWNQLYKIGGISAAIIAILIPIQIVVFIINPPPTEVIDWFNLFNTNPVMAYLDMDILLILDQILLGFVLLALFIKLRESNPSIALFSFVSGLLGISSYMSSTVVIEMASLAKQYANATTEAQKTLLLTSGQSMVVTWTGSAFTIGYILLGIAILGMNLVMSKSPDFSKRTANIGIVAGALSLIPASFGIIGMIFALLSLIPIEIWSIALAIDFPKMDY